MPFNSAQVAPIIQDEFLGEPNKRALQYIQNKRKQGTPVAGIYCGYAPIEVIRATGAVPAILCAFADKTIKAAEAVLPANLCPLIKSSYGFIITETCPFFALSDVVVAETTCDGKKKMFELIADRKPMQVMDLPQLPDEPKALLNWTRMIQRLQEFLEKNFHRQATEKALSEQINDSNRRNQLMNRLFDFAARKPPVVSWSEIYELSILAQIAWYDDLAPLLETGIQILEKRAAQGIFYGKPEAPRFLVTGCPVGGDAAKVFKIIEQAGGVIVALDACTGMKPFIGEIEENSSDPLAALARRYLSIPCSCMTPNERRLNELDKLIARFRPDAVVDVVLHACHSYNVESYKIKRHIEDKHGLPFLKIETDYSDGDLEQLRTRIEALLESLN